jgi:hypothetical protein
MSGNYKEKKDAAKWLATCLGKQQKEEMRVMYEIMSF